MAKPKAKAKTKKKLARRARRDVQLSVQPQLDALARQQAQAERDYGQGTNQVQAAYDALGRELGNVGAGFTDEAAKIAALFGGQVGQLGGMIGGAAAPAEQQAAQAFLGSIGGAGKGLLASDAMRNAAYNSSALRQGALERVTMTKNLAQDLLGTQDDIRQQVLDAKAMMPGLIRQRLGELRDTQFEHGLAGKELGLREAALLAQTKNDKSLSAYLMAQLQNDLKNTRRKKGQSKSKSKSKSNSGPSLANNKPRP